MLVKIQQHFRVTDRNRVEDGQRSTGGRDINGVEVKTMMASGGGGRWHAATL
jgi:hypothetical protein